MRAGGFHGNCSQRKLETERQKSGRREMRAFPTERQSHSGDEIRGELELKARGAWQGRDMAAELVMPVFAETIAILDSPEYGHCLVTI